MNFSGTPASFENCPPRPGPFKGAKHSAPMEKYTQQSTSSGRVSPLSQRERDRVRKDSLVGLWLGIVTLVCFCPRLFSADLAAHRAEGQRLAAEVRTLAPRANGTNTALLKIRDHRGVRAEIPVTIRTTVSDAAWHTDYISGDGLLYRVTRTPHAPSRYETGRANGPALQPAGNLLVPFAGSDFWLVDLGLDFFHWPEQRLVAKEQRKGQACFVLESTTPAPAPGGYSRVKTWLDQDTLGIVTAEAYDTRGQKLKTFEPKRFQKVAGKWQLKEMEIRNEQTDSRTSLVFDVDVQ